MTNPRNSCIWCLWIALTSWVIAAEPANPPAAPAALTIQQILVTDSIEGAQQLQPVPNGGFVVLAPSVSFLKAEELFKRIGGAKDRPIDDRILAAIAQAIETYARENDYSAASAVVPPQDPAGGVIRVALLVGKIRNIQIKGNQWFSESLLREKLKVERGEIVRISKLEPALNWANNSPYRQMKVHIQPLETGEVDMIVGVEDRPPVRLAVSYDNTGNEITGENRYSASLGYGNLWGRDHQLTYSFITTDDLSLFRAHAMEYRAPLPWRHLFSLSGVYVQLNPSFLEFFQQNAVSMNADAKYVVPLKFQKWLGEATATVAFKQTNNNLEFGGVAVEGVGATTDTLTGNLSFAAMREDRRGRWIISTGLTSSPGEFNSRSTRAIYNDTRLDANPFFVTWQIGVQRFTRLTPTLTSTIRTGFQLASANLMPSEQFSLGGLSSVRGYEERILSGDGGYAVTHELQHKWPTIKLPKKLPVLEMAGVLFWDYGRSIIKHPIVGQRKSDYIASVGVGLRASIANNLSGSVDVARQLEEVEVVGAARHRVHVKLTLAY